MKRERNWPEDSWHFDFDVEASQTDRCDELIALMGIVALDKSGQMRAPYNLKAQLEMVMDEMEIIVNGAKAELSSVVKLAAFYVGTVDDDKNVFQAIQHRFPADNQPLITAVPVSDLAYPGMMIEIDGYALAKQSGSPLERLTPKPGTLRSGNRLFIEGRNAPTNQRETLREQSLTAAQYLKDTLDGCDVHPEEVVQMYVYYASNEPDKDLITVGDACAEIFDNLGPVVTFIPLPRLGDARRVEIDTLAIHDDNKRTELPTTPEWNWPKEWPFVQALRRGSEIFIGGQVAYDENRNVIYPGDMVKQTRLVMDRIVELLKAFEATYNDVMKVQCWYNGGASVDALKRNALIRASYMTAPGGTSTGVPVLTSHHPQLEIQVDIHAIVD